MSATEKASPNPLARFSAHISDKLFAPVRESSINSLDEDDESGEIKLNQYVITKVLGKGAYGTVSLAHDDKGEEFAVKELSKSRIRRNWLSQTRFRNTNRHPTKPNPGASTTGGSNSDDEMYAVRKEIAILKKLHHPNIVKLIEVLEDNNQDSIYMVFEMCKNGPVFPSSGEGQPYSEEKCRALFQQIVLGVEYLHAHDIVHRDIKPDNLLLSHDNVVKIVDFGVSEMFDKGKDIVEKTAGSPAFLPPELCSNNPQSISGKAADIWSMGVTLYCLSFGKMPYTGSTLIDLYASIREKPLEIPPNTNPLLSDLLSKILNKDSLQRATIKDIREHPWVNNNGKEPLPTRKENLAVMISSDDITEEEIRASIKKITGIVTVLKAVHKLRRRTLSESSAASSSAARSSQLTP